MDWSAHLSFVQTGNSIICSKSLFGFCEFVNGLCYINIPIMAVYAVFPDITQSKDSSAFDIYLHDNMVLFWIYSIVFSSKELYTVPVQSFVSSLYLCIRHLWERDGDMKHESPKTHNIFNRSAEGTCFRRSTHIPRKNVKRWRSTNLIVFQ